MAVLVIASTTCDNQQYHSITIFTNNINMLVNLTHDKSCNIDTNL